MDHISISLLQKIEFGIVLALLAFHIVFLVINPEILEDLFLSESIKKEPKAPSDLISEEDIITYPNQVVLNIEDYTISRYAPTKSMVPVLDSGANGISIKPESEERLSVGDIITFRDGSDLVIHRIIEKGVDSEGIYFITKGDNNTISDGKIRFDEIESVLVALIY